jgi:hypothetical protein
VKRQTIQRGIGKQRVDGASFRLMEEVHYIQERAAEQDSRLITLAQLLLFSTPTGDAWLLEPADRLAVPLAREGDPLPIYLEETDKNFTIGWTGTYCIDGQAFVYSEQNSGRVRTILGYTTRHIVQQTGS